MRPSAGRYRQPAILGHHPLEQLTAAETRPFNSSNSRPVTKIKRRLVANKRSRAASVGGIDRPWWPASRHNRLANALIAHDQNSQKANRARVRSRRNQAAFHVISKIS